MDNISRIPAHGRRWRLLTCLLLLITGLGGLTWRLASRTSSPGELLAEARRLYRAEDFAGAEQSARDCFEEPGLEVDAVLLAAECAVRLQSPSRAVDYLERLQSLKTKSSLPAHLMRARLLVSSLCRLRDAEAAFRCVLQIDPAHPAANEELARLLATCGRRSEAIPHTLRVLQVDDNDLLMLLARESGLIHQPDLLHKCLETTPDDPLPPFGLSQYAAAQEQTDQAITLLRQSIAVDPRFAPAWAVLGQRLASSHRLDELAEWSAAVPSQANSFAETWRARGDLAEQTDQPEAAIRCWWESLKLAPESRQATFRLAQLLAQAGDNDSAQKLQARLQILDDLETAQNRAIFSGHQAGIDELIALIRSYQNAGRLWEAYAWGRVAMEVDPQELKVRRLWTELNRLTVDLPLQLTTPAYNLGQTLDLSRYPLPAATPQQQAAVARQASSGGAIHFRDDATSTGLQFVYHNGTQSPSSLKMFEFTGGGIGVIDADVDGYPDVFCTQGGERPHPASPEGSCDQLFRNIAGQQFVNVTGAAAILDAGFGQGIAIGDFDADGFPDVYVANIGPNLLWQNNGDGTFRRVAADTFSDDAWTTSCLMADLNGDALPDLYDVNYLSGEDVFERICQNPDGSPAMCMPFDFDGASDQLRLNDARGNFNNVTDEVLESPPDGKGLGIVAWDENGDGRLAMLIANDTTPNAFLTSATQDGHFVLNDSSITSGVGLNSEGKAEGCMGIALGDVDEDGQLDVHITNFLAESNTLYMADSGDGFFTDRTREVGLHEPTFNVLGFGTQFLDADLDGRLELFVANGHLQDLQRFGRPYRMPPQLFRFEAGQAQLIPPATIGPYFEQQWLGRAAARFDWNRDGREDLLVGHLEDPYALLTNTSPQPGNALTLRLVGTTSPREGTGATVRLRTGERRQVRQVTAGDGYQVSNEKTVVFGVGADEQIDEVLIHWPSGLKERFANLPSGLSAIVVEGSGRILHAH